MAASAPLPANRRCGKRCRRDWCEGLVGIEPHDREENCGCGEHLLGLVCRDSPEGKLRRSTRPALEAGRGLVGFPASVCQVLVR